MYQVAHSTISMSTDHIYVVTISYSAICIRWKFLGNIFLQLHTHKFDSGIFSRSIFHVTLYTEIYFQYHLLVVALYNCILSKFHWVGFSQSLIPANAYSEICIRYHLSIPWSDSIIAWSYRYFMADFIAGHGQSVWIGHQHSNLTI